MARIDVALSIRNDDGTLTKPAKISCSKGDDVFWSFTNDFARAVNVKLDGFKFRNGLGPFKKVIDLPTKDVDINPRQTRTLGGGVAHNVRKKDEKDALKYTIIVTDLSNEDEDVYDPDLEVLPPPPETVPPPGGGGRRNPKGSKGAPR